MRICLTQEEFDSTDGHKILASKLGYPNLKNYFDGLIRMYNTPEQQKYVLNTYGPHQDLINAASTVTVRSWGHYADSLMGIKHILSNQPLISKTPILDGFLPNVVWVATGPYMLDHLDVIREAKAKGWMIACADASLKPLLEALITPDMVFLTERGSETLELFSGLPEGAEELIKDVWLNSGIYTHPLVLDQWKGKLCFHFRNQAEAMYMFPGLSPKDIQQQQPHLSVPSLSWLISRGCQQLILVGQDLAYHDDGSSHAKGSAATIHETRKQVRANDGSLVYSNTHWVEWALDIGNLFALHPDLIVYNLSLKGLPIANTLLVKDKPDFMSWLSKAPSEFDLTLSDPPKSRDLSEILKQLSHFNPIMIKKGMDYWKHEVVVNMMFPLVLQEYCYWHMNEYRQMLLGKKWPFYKLQDVFKRAKADLKDVLTKVVKGEQVWTK